MTCVWRIAREAARYSQKLCKAILRGMHQQMISDGIIRPGCEGLHNVDEQPEVVVNLKGPEQGYSGRFKDDLTGQPLRDDLVLEARDKEMSYFHQKGVWRKRPRQECFQRTGKPPVACDGWT